MDQLTAPTMKRYRMGIKGHPMSTFVDGRGRECRGYAPGLKHQHAATIVVEGLSADDAKGRFMRENKITQVTGDPWIIDETQEPVTPLTLAAPEEPKPEPAPKVEVPKPAKAGK